jgi:hypothetical protein
MPIASAVLSAADLRTPQPLKTPLRLHPLLPAPLPRRSCVLLFSMQRPEFPVDTHVHHIAKSMAWCPPNCSREQAYEHLNSAVPGKCSLVGARAGGCCVLHPHQPVHK